MIIDKQIEEVIVKAVSDANRYPFLFIGSGISRRYTGAPGWEGLLQDVCACTLHDSFAFARLKSQATIACQNGVAPSVMPHIATLMEGPVNSILFSDENYGDFRARHEADLQEGISPMKLLIADMLQEYVVSDTEEIGALSDAGIEKISGIITTNYDTLCEDLFPGFKTYVGESDLLFSEQGYAQEIYKIHGSVCDPSSMVLTTADYAEFDRKRKYLAAKLLTIFIEYPVIFLGYSIQDKNIQAILEEISECLPDDKFERLQKRLVFVQHGDSTEVSSHSLSFGDKMLTMTKVITDDFGSIYGALLNTRKLYDTKFIREIRGSIFRLAERVDPSSEVVVSGVDSVLNKLDDNQKVVIGLSVSQMGVGLPISPEDIIEDVVLDNLHYDPKLIVEWYLNRFVRQLQNSMPVFKYIRDLEIDEVGKDVANYASGLTSIDSFRTRTIRNQMRTNRERLQGDLSVKGIARQVSKSPFSFIPYLEENEINVDDLGNLLTEHLLAVDDSPQAKLGLLKDTSYRKCVRIYDYLRYK